ncbi:NrfD/PsrC family molybdoenzyme membrane anchor subunit [Geothrix fuzhouensis]|uniref:NrfD/PsrC family molybdoenzyme membrane anchor subunit n=1 Tax=Geothrix fuzhouensis TaxID=2966451 RepID=UPI0021476FAE|nr:NrfD/PsrC family molybdoenzyme membrane anchor subunit [Geothrix fuzhouensis]
MHEFNWGLLIVIYLFLGGLSAGLFFAAGLADYMTVDDKPVYARVARMGAFLAPWPVAIGSGLLILDLGNWYRFYKLFIHFRWESPMSIGSYLLTIFTVIAFLYLFAWLTADERQWLFSKVPATWKQVHRLNVDISSWRGKIAMVGFPFSIGVGIYTGVLLGAVSARPFWNTNLVAQMFLFSALSSGAAALMLAMVLNKKSPAEKHEIKFLVTLDVVFISLELFIILPYLIHGQLSSLAVKQALSLILGGPYTFVFWGPFLVMGLLVPLAIEVYELAPNIFKGHEFHGSRNLALTAAGLVLIGGFLLRYIFVYAGQVSSFHQMGMLN